MRLLISTLYGRQELQVDPEMKQQQLGQLLEERCGVPQARQRLVSGRGAGRGAGGALPKP